MRVTQLFTIVFMLQSTVFFTAQANSLLFNFGTQNKQTGGTTISAATPLSAQQTYGFDFNSANHAVFEQHAFVAKETVYFSVILPEGNYRLELILGSQQRVSANTIKAESRRVLLNQFWLNKGQSSRQLFTINLRSPKIDQQQAIAIKPREVNYLNWDNKLTLEFAAGSAIQQIKLTQTEHVTRVFLAGDSTVTDQEQAPYASWGQMITQYLDESVVVANFAESGESLTSFKQSKRWDKILSLLHANDYVFIEFSHNDEKLQGEGIGPWQSYSDLLREFILTSRAKGAIPVLLTPTQRRFFKPDGTLKASHGDFPDAMRAVATELKVPLIDITHMSTIVYQSWGDELSKKAFVHYPANTFAHQTKTLNDNTHFNPFGANEMALCVLTGIASLDLDLKQAIKPGILPYNPAKPNQVSEWTLPMSQRFDLTKPDGN